VKPLPQLAALGRHRSATIAGAPASEGNPLSDQEGTGQRLSRSPRLGAVREASRPSLPPPSTAVGRGSDGEGSVVQVKSLPQLVARVRPRAATLSRAPASGDDLLSDQEGVGQSPSRSPRLGAVREASRPSSPPPPTALGRGSGRPSSIMLQGSLSFMPDAVGGASAAQPGESVALQNDLPRDERELLGSSAVAIKQLGQRRSPRGEQSESGELLASSAVIKQRRGLGASLSRESGELLGSSAAVRQLGQRRSPRGEQSESGELLGSSAAIKQLGQRHSLRASEQSESGELLGWPAYEQQLGERRSLSASEQAESGELQRSSAVEIRRDRPDTLMSNSPNTTGAKTALEKLAANMLRRRNIAQVLQMLPGSK
jgi:hypothetical protein